MERAVVIFAELMRTLGSREILGVKCERLASASMSEKVMVFFPKYQGALWKSGTLPILNWLTNQSTKRE